MSFDNLKIKEEDFEGKNIQSIESDTVIGRADELKKLFDAPAQEVLKQKINDLIDYLQTVTAAGEIGTPEISEGSGTTVADQLSYLFREMQNISSGSIASGSIEDDKLSNGEGQIKEVVAYLKGVLNVLEEDAPNNSLVSWNATLGDNDEEELYLKYLKTKLGACYADEANGEAKFGTLPMSCGGTGYKGLVNAPKSAFIVKRVSDSGENYLGYVTAEQVASTIGAVPKTRKVNGHALGSDIALTAEDVGAVPKTRKVNKKELNGDITLGYADFELSVTADTVPGAILLEPSITLRRYFFVDACIFRMYFKNGEKLTAGTEYDVCSFADVFAPSARHALACSGIADCSAVVTADGVVKFRPKADVAAGYSFYISGIWMI